jgi:hypothetical protein
VAKGGGIWVANGDARSEVSEIGNESVNQVAGACMWNALYDRHNVYHLVTLENAKAKVVEVKNFQKKLPGVRYELS